jgi:predicted membrane chloride channel (bestrophin family)
MTLSRWNHAVLLIAALASQIGEASAFVGASLNNGRTSTELYGNTKAPPLIPMPKGISYGEESRRYRRTVYSHDDWVKHRSPDRFFRNIISVLTSGIYKNIQNEVTFVTCIATLVVLWNAMVEGYTDFEGVKHAGLLAGTIAPILTLPMAPFTLSSTSLGLLLGTSLIFDQSLFVDSIRVSHTLTFSPSLAVFRTNTGYQRWDEARKNWGMNINHTRDLVRMGTAWYDMSGVSPERRKEDLQALSLATWSFVRAMQCHLSPESEDEEDFKKELYEKLPQEQAQAIIDAAHRPNRALFDLSVEIENLPMHFMRKNELNKAVTILEDNLGSSERLLTSPVPLFYSLHTTRFLLFWIMGLPFALYDSFSTSWNHTAMIPSMGVLAVFLMGIEELANQMEEPFTILPMQVFCDKIYDWCTEIVSWEAGDNGRRVHEAAEKHVSVSTAMVEMSNGETPNETNGGSTDETNESSATGS